MILRCLALSLGLLFSGIGVLRTQASDTYVPPLPPSQNKALLTGEKLWRSTQLVGPSGETCAGCHDSAQGPPLAAASLVVKRDDLPKLIYFCILTRNRNNIVKPGGPEVLALVEYLKNRYRLDKVKPVFDDPKALAVIAQARQLYLAGDYPGAIVALNQTLELTLSPETAAESHILLGSIFDVLGDQRRAREEFAQVFRLFPSAQIDHETFSPKTVELFDSVRAEVTNP
jgi:hypothetical protein